MWFSNVRLRVSAVSCPFPVLSYWYFSRCIFDRSKVLQCWVNRTWRHFSNSNRPPFRSALLTLSVVALTPTPQNLPPISISRPLPHVGSDHTQDEKSVSVLLAKSSVDCWYTRWILISCLQNPRKENGCRIIGNSSWLNLELRPQLSLLV